MKKFPHFDAGEFECHDGTPVPEHFFGNLERLIGDVLEPIREAFGAPVIVVSGYRSPRHNRRVSRAVRSKHLTAQAADIQPVHHSDLPKLIETIERLYAEGKLPALGGLGTYRRWVHVDTDVVSRGLRRWPKA